MMKKQDKILTRLVLGTILAGGAGLMMPQVVSATDGAIAQSASTSLTIDSTSVNEAGTTAGSSDNVYGNITYEKTGSTYNIVSTTALAPGSESVIAAFGASGYTVTVNSGTFGNVYGGYGYSSDANNNKVIINGGTLAQAVGGHSDNGNANNNTVTLNDGTVGYLRGGDTFSGSSDGNTINVLGGNITNGIYAGGFGTTSNNNTINILTAIDIPGDLNFGETSGSHSGNTLNIAAKGVSAERILSANNINFYLPSDIAANETMLTLTGTSPSDANLTGVTFGVTALTGVTLNKGDTVTLLKSTGTTLTTDATLSTADSSTLSSASFLSLRSLDTIDKYTFTISKQGDNALIATVDSVDSQSTTEDNTNSTDSNSGNNSSNSGNNSSDSSTASTSNNVNDVKKSTVETRAAAVSMLTQASDFMASTGFSEAANAVSQAAAEAQAGGASAPSAAAFTPFAAMGGQKMRAESGSHVDIRGFGLNIGFAREVANKDGKLLFGPVVEYGRGSYDSYNNDVHGDGKSSFWGIGLMARQTNHDGLYYEGSVRGGRSKSDYASAVTVRGLPVNLSYDSSSTYWSAHLGVGKIFAVSADNTVDAYLKYFYTHQSGDTVTLNPGLGTLDFDSVDSNRIRIGSRLTHKINNKDSIYGGLAYQYEFGGEARATYNGTATPAPSVKGSSGMLELGYILKASDKVSLDFGVTGWAGKQRGITGQIGALWKF